MPCKQRCSSGRCIGSAGSDLPRVVQDCCDRAGNGVWRPFRDDCGISAPGSSRPVDRERTSWALWALGLKCSVPPWIGTRSRSRRASSGWRGAFAGGAIRHGGDDRGVPRISAFYGILITMYWLEHSPPAFHAAYAGHVAQIEIESLAVIDGWLPPRVLRLVADWGELHQAGLRASWDHARGPRVARADRAAALGLRSWSLSRQLSPWMRTRFASASTMDASAWWISRASCGVRWLKRSSILSISRRVRVDPELRTIVWPERLRSRSRRPARRSRPRRLRRSRAGPSRRFVGPSWPQTRLTWLARGLIPGSKLRRRLAALHRSGERNRRRTESR